MKIIFSLIVIFLSTPVLGQNFSGEILYEEFNSNKDEDYNSRLGSSENKATSIYLISDEAYKFSQFENDTFKLSYTYDPQTKNLIDEDPNLSYLTFRSSKRSYSKPKNVTILEDSLINILGYSCFPVVLEYKDRTTTKYFSEDVRIKINAFEGHNLGYWYQCLELTEGGISLRSISVFPTKTSITNAIRITERKIKKEEFKIPESKRLVASGYDLEKPPKLYQPNEDQLKCYRTKLLYGQSLVDKETTSIAVFIVTKSGEKEEIKFINSEHKGLDEVTLDILNNCGLSIIPGEMNDEHIDATYYFPVKYTPLVKK